MRGVAFDAATRHLVGVRLHPDAEDGAGGQLWSVVCLGPGFNPDIPGTQESTKVLSQVQATHAAPFSPWPVAAHGGRCVVPDLLDSSNLKVGL